MPLTWTEYEQRLGEIKSQRRSGQVSAKQAYEDHMALLASANPSYRAEPVSRLEVSGRLVFKDIWFRPAERSPGQEYKQAYNDIGSLHFMDDTIVFDGAQQQIVIARPRSVTYSRQGSDLVNNWVKVVYGEGHESEVAFFADGRFMGWAGVLGGTKRIFETIALFVEPLLLT